MPGRRHGNPARGCEGCQPESHTVPRRGNHQSAIIGPFASLCGISDSPRPFAGEQSVEQPWCPARRKEHLYPSKKVPNRPTVTLTVPPEPGAALTTAIAVFTALDGRHGEKSRYTVPTPLANGAVNCVKFIVPPITPVTVALPVAAPVALAMISRPHIHVR
jgi:hypothetical protein